MYSFQLKRPKRSQFIQGFCTALPSRLSATALALPSLTLFSHIIYKVKEMFTCTPSSEVILKRVLRHAVYTWPVTTQGAVSQQDEVQHHRLQTQAKPILHPSSHY